MVELGELSKQEREQISHEEPKQENLIITLSKIFLKNPSSIKRMRVMDPDENLFVRPPRQYDVPPFRKGMKYCSSNEKYLRPRWWCNPREPEVIATANELGAYELPDRKFAEAAYWFVKTKMWYEIYPFDSAAVTLRRGSGMCNQLVNVFVALCRSAGIKVRYKQFDMRFREIEQEIFTDVDPAMKQLSEAAGGVVPEAEAEVYIDGEWEPAYLAQTAAMMGVHGWPITEFGESCIGLYFDALPESIKRFESTSLKLGLSLKLMHWLAPASIERMNTRMMRIQLLGLKEIEEAGGIQAYNEMAKKRRELFSADEILNQQLLKHYDRYDKLVVKKK